VPSTTGPGRMRFAAASDIIGPIATTVHRKLTFYAWRNGLKRRPFDRLAAARAVKGLEGDPDSVVEIEGTLVAALVSAVGTATKPSRFQLLPLRDYENRPLRFRPGAALSAITLASGEYTSDVAHIALWPDGYAAYDAHGFAPGPQRLAAYLRETCEERVDFFALYDRELLDYVKSLEGLTAVEFSITSSEKAQRAMDSQKGVFAGLISARRGLEEISFGTRISVGRSRGRRLDPQLQADVLDLADKAEDYFDSLRVTGIDPDTKKSVEVNLLQTRLHMPVDLPRARGGGNAPSPARCFSELDAAKRKLGKRKLEEALRARVS
jgi:hypothetical protein